MEFRRLGKTELQVSILGFGASPMGNVFDPVDESTALASAHLAIDQGINFFDVAPFYGLTLAETRLGKALKGKRDKVTLASKCGRYGLEEFDFSRERIFSSIEDSLKRLQTDYLDLYQLHDIEFVDKSLITEVAIPALHEVKKSGKARFVGITGLPVRYLAQIAREVEIDTILSWGHYNLLEDEINDELVPLSREKDLGLMNAAPLMQRILSDAELPEWHRSPDEVKALQPKLIELCKSYELDLSQVAMNFAMKHEGISTTIVGMCEPEIVEKNLAAIDLSIPEELMKSIEKLVAPYKNQMWFEGKPENNL
ncbi:aldo/keto reductase [Algoriphagus sediminis]|uniref:Aldo/keto reductase n=1 Tax=Algoriphagus sediminis TaxID=3057113 RepID=A0ABT7YCR8_9BACT|nr:aldo/keto reductase [Algoriphagus sediminis]MDN3204302.1 aldo/keto reductase [Algoriphagus sediminis]